MDLEEKQVAFRRYFSIVDKLLHVLFRILVSHRIRYELLAHSKVQESHSQFAVLPFPKPFVEAAHALQY